jgi:hypothetical protein
VGDGTRRPRAAGLRPLSAASTEQAVEKLSILARRLGLQVRPDRRQAEGRWEGIAFVLRVDAGRMPEGTRLRARASLPQASDLTCSLVRGSERGLRTWPWSHLKTEPTPTGDGELDGWLELRGPCEPERVVAWLTPLVRERLRALDGQLGLVVERSWIGIFLDETADADQLEVALGLLREAAIALDQARSKVPVATTLDPWVSVFEDLARTLGLSASMCPLAAEGMVDGFQVLVHAPSWGPFQDGMVLVDVTRPGPLGARWDLPIDGFWIKLLRRALGIVQRTSRSPLLEPLLKKLRPPAPLGFPSGFVVSGASDGRVVAACRLRPGRELDLAGAVRRAIALMKERGGAAEVEGRSPYR